MCVIIYKPRGVSLSKEVLHAAWIDNPHGAGFAVRADGILFNTVYFEKGFMNFEEFYSRYLDFQNEELVIHFRLATSGQIIPEHTHPFPLDRDVELFALKGNSRVLFHNGVIGHLTNAIVPDTALLVDMIRYVGYSDAEIVDILADFRASKFALVTPKGVALIGQFYERYGCYFSSLVSDEYAKFLKEVKRYRSKANNKKTRR